MRHPQISPQTVFAVEKPPLQSFFQGGAKPYVRWWWLAGPFQKEDIRCQLDWIKATGFGGVELAWICPLWQLLPVDSADSPGWLSAEWSALVAETKLYADQIGLGCDFTFGSCWPFGGSCVRLEEASQRFDGTPTQFLEGSWESPLNRPLFVVDHLSKTALYAYAAALMRAFAPGLAGSRSGLFCDSLEIETARLWSPRLWDEFAEEFGYRLEPYRDALDEQPAIRYDYRKFIAQVMVREFYAPFTEICHAQGAFSRVQCHRSPTDLLTSYSTADVPESEALLFNPSFSRIAASAAALSDKPVVSAETFTCIYGFTSLHHSDAYRKVEHIADLKLLADAVIANGVNQIVWHGMPYNPPGGANEFYASVHVGPDTRFVDQIPRFNAYLETVCGVMRLGRTASELAVYLPNEDGRMLNRLPVELLTPGAGYWWEMRHVEPPPETDGFQPLWISPFFLKVATACDGRLQIGPQSFAALYIDVAWLDADALAEIERLAWDGVTVILKRRPEQPGRLPRSGYAQQREALARMPNVVDDLKETNLRPLVSGDELPPYWVRRTATHWYWFFAHPRARGVQYPMPYGYSHSPTSVRREATLQAGSALAKVELVFEPYQSILLRMGANGTVEFIDAAYRPPEPVTD